MKVNVNKFSIEIYFNNHTNQTYFEYMFVTTLYLN